MAAAIPREVDCACSCGSAWLIRSDPWAAIWRRADVLNRGAVTVIVQLTISEHSQCAKHHAEHLKCIVPFNLHENSKRQIICSLFVDKESEVQEDNATGPLFTVWDQNLNLGSLTSEPALLATMMS